MRSRATVRRSFLLVEVLTSSCIASIIIVACLTLLMIFVSTKGKEAARLEATQKQLQEVGNLRWVLSHIGDDRENKHLFLSGENPGNCLIFRMDIGFSETPNEVSTSLAMLYIDKEKGLMLVHKPPKERKELGYEEGKGFPIWKGVKNIRWLFLTKNELTDDLLEWKESWTKGDVWAKEGKTLPLAIKATVTEELPSGATINTEVTTLLVNGFSHIALQAR